MSEISLLDQNFPATTGEINLTQLNTEWLVIYFYPKDSTRGCTTQAVGFSCLKDQFDALNTTILSVYRDSVIAQQKFTKKHNPTINLIIDKENVLCNHIKAIKQINMYGKQLTGTDRSTTFFYSVIMLKAYRNVKAASNEEAVMER